jgi:hypothetical protein
MKKQSILDIPAYPVPRYNGGAIKLRPDNNSLNVAMGDVAGSNDPAMGTYMSYQ